MLNISKRQIILLAVLIAALILSGCAGSSPANSTPNVVTVIQTVPVEVTRIVEITQAVEVTRQVVVTQIVEVPVTVTPNPTVEATPTPTLLPFPTLTPILATQITPQGKGNGFVPFFLVNQTQDRLDVYITGPLTPAPVALSPDSSFKVFLREGDYFYSVWRDGKVAYEGGFRITNIDKHQLILQENKAVFWIP